VVSRIKQINPDGDRKIYEPLTNHSVDKTSPWCGGKPRLCDDHMIDKLFKTNVSVTENNKAFVEYTLKRNAGIRTRTLWHSWTVTWQNKVLATPAPTTKSLRVN
jgi:hypothetical protein